MAICITRNNLLKYLFTDPNDFKDNCINWSTIGKFYNIFHHEIVTKGVNKIGYQYTYFAHDEELDRDHFLDFGDEIICIKYDSNGETKIENKYNNDEIIVNALRTAKATVLSIPRKKA